MTDSDVLWPTPWVRAALDTAILGCLVTGPLHGYAIATALRERGFGQLKGGSLYPALARLEESGAVTTAWVEGSGGPGRRQYTLTSAGRARMRDDVQAWRRLVDTLDPTDEQKGHSA